MYDAFYVEDLGRGCSENIARSLYKQGFFIDFPIVANGEKRGRELLCTVLEYI